MLTFDSVDEIQTWVLQSLLKEGREAEPRGLRTLELLGVSLALRRPRRRCVVHPTRRWSLPAAIGEFAWHVSGSRDLAFIGYYFKRWKQLSDDPTSVQGSCYGYRIFNRYRDGQTNWDRMIRVLRTDPSSRRAVLDVYDSEISLDPSVKDSPCACTLQFLIRDGRLHLIAHMRSNDVIWGLPYDVFFFTMLQELLAHELERPLGTYTHMVGSLHLYQHHFELAREILRSRSDTPFEMPPMAVFGHLPRFLEIESRLRLGADASLDVLDPYWRDLAVVLQSYRILKIGGSPEDALESVPVGSQYASLLQNLWRDPHDRVVAVPQR